MKNHPINTPVELSADEAETVKSLFNYPSLERIFDADNAGNSTKLKQKMRSTIEDLERVIRHGAKDDAEKAARAVKAVQKTLDFLDEIERTRQSKTN